MVNVDVDVEDALMEAEELNDAEYDVYRLRSASEPRENLFSLPTVDVAEATRFTLFRVMQASSPVDGHIALSPIEPCCALHTTAGADAAEVEQTIKHWTVIADVVFALLFLIVVHIVRRDFAEKVDVLVCVELGHFELVGRFRALDNL